MLNKDIWQDKNNGGKVANDAVCLLSFRDDHILKDKFKAGDMLNELQTILNLEKILGNIEAWMNGNRLKMNSDKLGNTTWILSNAMQNMYTR